MRIGRCKRFAAVALVVASVSLMTGCAVDSSERAACESSGGVVKSERFPYKDFDSAFGKTSTGSLSYCESSDGLMTAVYNEKVVELEDGLFSPNKSNREVFEKCSELGGDTYKTRKSSGKNNRVTRFACVVDGAYVVILK